LKGTEGLIDKYIKKYKDYKDARLDKLADLKAKAKADNAMLQRIQTRLPINVPQPMYIEKMLEEEKCLVCDREAPKGEDAWNKIKELLDSSKEKSPSVSEDDVAPNNFSLEFDQLSNNAYAMQQLIKGIDDDINSALQEITKIESRKQSYTKDVEKKKQLIANFITESGLSADEASRITSQYQTQNEYAQRFSGDLERTKLQIELKEKELKRIEAELRDLVSGDMPDALIEKKEIFEAFQHIAGSTRDRVFKKLVSQLEDEANKHYKNMMQGNLSAQGIIKLVESSKGNFMPRLVDEGGNILSQLNTGNIILIKLATIMAIISARQGSRDTDLYTLITDAPMSVFGEDYTIGFCKTVSHVYRQSIIMSKEFYQNEELRRDLMNDKEIKRGNIYMITPSIPEKDRANRNSLETKIQKLN
jgi:DNA sulfur modification protein DndD